MDFKQKGAYEALEYGPTKEPRFPLEEKRPYNVTATDHQQARVPGRDDDVDYRRIAEIEGITVEEAKQWVDGLQAGLVRELNRPSSTVEMLKRLDSQHVILGPDGVQIRGPGHLVEGQARRNAEAEQLRNRMENERRINRVLGDEAPLLPSAAIPLMTREQAMRAGQLAMTKQEYERFAVMSPEQRAVYSRFKLASQQKELKKLDGVAIGTAQAAKRPRNERKQERRRQKEARRRNR